MTEKETIFGDCPERVALDLAEKIEHATADRGSNPTRRDEAYWIGLYARCLKAVKYPSRVGQPE